MCQTEDVKVYSQAFFGGPIALSAHTLGLQTLGRGMCLRAAVKWGWQQADGAGEWKCTRA